MTLMILNGPTGTGKNTISEIIAQKRDRCAVIDYDVLHNMFRRPHLTPWDGVEGAKQNMVGVEHACDMAKSFVDNDYDCIILDVLSDEKARLYQERLQGYQLKLVFLLPSFDEIIRRNKTRPPRLTDDELKMVYQQQANLTVFDHKIDNTNMSADEVATTVLKLM